MSNMTLILNLDSIMICNFVHLASKFVDEILKMFAVLILVSHFVKYPCIILDKKLV